MPRDGISQLEHVGFTLQRGTTGGVGGNLQSADSQEWAAGGGRAVHGAAVGAVLLLLLPRGAPAARPHRAGPTAASLSAALHQLQRFIAVTSGFLAVAAEQAHRGEAGGQPAVPPRAGRKMSASAAPRGGTGRDGAAAELCPPPRARKQSEGRGRDPRSRGKKDLHGKWCIRTSCARQHCQLPARPLSSEEGVQLAGGS